MAWRLWTGRLAGAIAFLAFGRRNVGQSLERYDISPKVDGSLTWAVDVTLPGMVRSEEKFEEHLELVRCYYYYKFVRRHRALRFGRKIRTPAMQAGLVTRRLTLSEIFVCTPSFLSFIISTLIENDAIVIPRARRPATNVQLAPAA